jgi:hypothetical protein
MGNWIYEGIACYVAGVPQTNLVPLYRAWNGSDHFYTSSENEYKNLPNSYSKEGIACYVSPASLDGYIPLFRLYKGSIDDHLYSTSSEERDAAVKQGYKFEEIQCYVKSGANQSDGFVPFYRAYNSRISDHFYTIDLDELAAATGTRLEASNGAGIAHVTLETIKVKQKQEIFRDEIYLWVYGLVIDNGTLKTRKFIISHPGGHGNIGSAMGGGDSRRIKPDVGAAVRTQIQPLQTVAAIGAIVIAWEEDNTPNDKILEAYEATAKILNTFILDRVNQLKIENPTETELTQLKKDISTKVGGIFAKGVKWYNPFSLDHDDFIGVNSLFVTLNSTKNMLKPFTLMFKGEGAEYKITGAVGYSLV